MFCTKCGKPIEDGNAFCTSCGAKVESPTTPEATKPLNSDAQAAMDSLSQDATPTASATVANDETTPLDATNISAAEPTAPLTYQESTNYQAPNVQADQTAQMPSTPQGQEPQKKSKKPLTIALAILTVAVLAGGGAFAYFTFAPNASSTTSEETAEDVGTVVNYSSTETISAKRNTRFVPYDVNGNKLTKYTVVLTTSSSSDATRTSYTYTVDGTDGFQFTDFEELESGTYEPTVIDQDDNAYTLPTINYDKDAEAQNTSNSPDNQTDTAEYVETVSLITDSDPVNILEAITADDYSFTTVTEDVSVPQQDASQAAKVTTWSYVQLSCLLPNPAIDTINAAVRSTYENDKATCTQTSEDGSFTLATYRNYDIACTYLSEDYVSFRIRYVETTYGSEDAYATKSLTYNIKTGERVDAASLWGYSNADLVSDTTSAASSAIADWSDDTSWYTSIISNDAYESIHPNYYITNQGLTYETMSSVYSDSSAYYAPVVVADIADIIPAETIAANTSTTSSISVETKSDASLSTSVFTEASASSELATSSYGNYFATNVLDGDATTAWVEGASGAGTGETLTLSSTSGTQDITTIEILNGYNKDEDIYTKNTRPKQVTILADGTEIGTVTLSDTYGKTQVLTFPSVSASSITIEINSVYAGSKYEDCCISEVRVY